MIGPPQQIFHILLAKITFNLDMATQLGYFQTPLGWVFGTGDLDILLVYDPHLCPFQLDTFFVGHAHERNNRSISQAHLQKGKGVWPFVSTS